MQIIRGLHNLKSYQKKLRQKFGKRSSNDNDPQQQQTKINNSAIITIGNYDGFHIGHQAILQQVKALATATHFPSILVTFEPLPREYFSHSTTPQRLTNFREKISLLRHYGIDAILFVRFDHAFATITAPAFIEDILVKQLHAKHIVVGEDFAFGHNHLGNIQLLQQYSSKYGYTLSPIPITKIANHRVSSSLIRKNLQHGDLAMVQKLLGRPYSITGRIIHGDQRGRALGFPTANVAVNHKTLTFAGVYAVRVTLDNHTINGIANIGFRPTVETQRPPKRLLEVHLFDFQQNIYGRFITVEFLHKLRSEQKFANYGSLQKQIALDVDNAKTYFNSPALP
jgi:riboflavin kinase / FMN adenylyltransferase